MAGIFKKDEIEKVAQHLERYASDSQIATLEHLAKIAMHHETLARERAEAQPVASTSSASDRLHRSLAASVGLGRS